MRVLLATVIVLCGFVLVCLCFESIGDVSHQFTKYISDAAQVLECPSPSMATVRVLLVLPPLTTLFSD